MSQEHPPTNHEPPRSMPQSAPAESRLARNLTVACGALLGVGVIGVLAAADSRMFEDAEFSPLYESTLNEAFNRFKQSDQQVPAGKSAAASPNANPQLAGPPAPNASPGGSQFTPAQIAQMRRLQQQRAQQGTAGGNTAGHAGHTHDDGGPHTKKGDQHLQNKEYEKAIAEYRLALAENPNRPLAQHHIGDALRYLGKHREAIAAYEKVLKLSPTYYCCYTHMGEIQRDHLKNKPQADAAFTKAIAGYRDQVKNGGAQGTIAKYHLAKLLMDGNRDLPEAIKLASQAATESPDQPVYHHLLAQCYEAAGRYADAARAIEKAIQLKPQHVEFYVNYKKRLESGAATKPPAPQ